MDYDLLILYYKLRDVKKVSEILQKAEEAGEVVDILYDENYFIGLAIAHQYVGVLKVLVKYYERKYLTDEIEKSNYHEYLYRKQLLSDAIENAIDSTFTEPTPEVLEIIKPYMPVKNDDSDSTAGFDAEPDPTGDYEGRGYFNEDGELLGAENNITSHIE